MKKALFSEKSDMYVAFFNNYDKEVIKNVIIGHLRNNPTDTLEYCKEYSKKDIKRFYGMEVIDFYAVNPKNGKVSKLVIRNDKTYYKSIE